MLFFCSRPNILVSSLTSVTCDWEVDQSSVFLLPTRRYVDWPLFPVAQRAFPVSSWCFPRRPISYMNRIKLTAKSIGSNRSLIESESIFFVNCMKINPDWRDYWIKWKGLKSPHLYPQAYMLHLENHSLYFCFLNMESKSVNRIAFNFIGLHSSHVIFHGSISQLWKKYQFTSSSIFFACSTLV